MFNLKFRKQNLLDGEGEGGAPTSDPAPIGENAAPSADAGSVLDADANLSANAPNLNVEQFLSGFSHEDKESASKYANNYVDEQGNLNVANMIKSGYNLEKKLGAFTGAPESYEIPTPDYLEGDINTDDPYLQEFMTLAKDSNMSQDSFQKFMDVHLRASIAPPVDLSEMQKEIGPEFNAMRSNMAGFFKNRLDDDSFKALNGLINSPESFKALYNVYKASKPTKVDDAVRDNFNQAELESQMNAEYLAEDHNGNPKMRDPIYAKSWRERWEPHIKQQNE
jgi:hypothetical protein